MGVTRTASHWSACVILLVGAAACTDPLAVSNTNSPDRNAALATVTDLENFLGNTYAVVHQGTLGGATVLGGGSNDALQPQLLTAGMENVSGLANFAMGPRSAIPRNPIDNTPGSQGNVGDYRDFVVEHRAARLATLALAHIPVLGTLGSPARDARARAFGKFVEGTALGNLALAYDSAAILSESNSTQLIVPLSSHQAVMAAALSDLDSAIALAQAAPTLAGAASDNFPLPATWINEASASVTAALFVQLARSYKARFRAGVARTPAERAAVDWNAVIADATAGITSDFTVVMAPSSGWDISWVIQQYATGSANWHQMSQFFLGMADTSGGYDTWLNTPDASRVPFLVVTPDKRLPAGTTRALQNAVVVPGTFSTVPYFQNRAPGQDAPGDPLQISMYDFRRSGTFQAAARNGPYPIMTVAEIRLLAAEGQLRIGNVGAAAALIDVSRVGRGGLPSLVTAGIADTLTPVPGVTSCVPRVPDPAQGYKKSRCGTIWGALKWEYRLETAYTGYGMWFFAARGWGDLPEGTAIQWPVPYQEMQVRGEPYYGLGGVGQVGGAAKGSLGLFSGGVYP